MKVRDAVVARIKIRVRDQSHSSSHHGHIHFVTLDSYRFISIVEANETDGTMHHIYFHAGVFFCRDVCFIGLPKHGAVPVYPSTPSLPPSLTPWTPTLWTDETIEP